VEDSPHEHREHLPIAAALLILGAVAVFVWIVVRRGR
jgi:hypothetical protein